MSDRPGDEVSALEVAGAPAARVRRREPVADADGLSTGELPITRLQVYVPRPPSPFLGYLKPVSEELKPAG